MNRNGWQGVVIAIILFALAALVPLVANGYHLSVAVTAIMYVALATSWSLFSGPTHYISLASGAFFGVGGYLVAIGMSDYNLSFWLMAAIAPLVAAVLATLIGLATLRLSGVYFVIFTLGLAEMVRNLVSWIQNNFLGSRGLYVLTDFTESHIYWMLLAVCGVIFIFGWWLGGSRLGFALRIIGNDEAVAKHVGINTALSKVILFMTTGFFAALVGAIIAPRYSYIEPNQVFSPELSFLVVIMALLGGANRLWGPLAGVIPFTIIWEVINSNFSNFSTLFLGLSFLTIVYLIPNGFVGLIEKATKRVSAKTLGEDARVSTGRTLLQISGATKRFGGLIAVNNISFDVKEHEVMGIIGPNGSGKTTMMNLISGELRVTSGTIAMQGKRLSQLPPHLIARSGIARTFQLVKILPGLSVIDNVIAGAAFGHRRRWGHEAHHFAETLLDRLGLGEHMHLPVDALTYIDQKRLELARALASEPQVLLLDEWLAGLNPTELQIGIDLVANLRQEGRTIILVEHVMDAIRSLCDSCVVMNSGKKIAEGKPSQVLADPEVIRAYLGDE